ncbi:MAG: hypothetical protein IKQ37_05565 [Bacteroidaceae bacterium]|nr:hypothetical protein [Bacteroidaceae bacterium]
MNTQVEQIKAEVRKRLDVLQYEIHKLGNFQELKSLLSFIDSLPEEPGCIYNRTLEERQRCCRYCSAACQARTETPFDYEHATVPQKDFAPKFDERIQDGDEVVYNEDMGGRINLSRLQRVAVSEVLEEAANTYAKQEEDKAGCGIEFITTDLVKAVIFGAKWKEAQVKDHHS